MWYYSMRKIDILLFIRFSSFPINKMLYLYIYIYIYIYIKYIVQYKTLKNIKQKS
jgi:hypothetical protein